MANECINPSFLLLACCLFLAFKVNEAKGTWCEPLLEVMFFLFLQIMLLTGKDWIVVGHGRRAERRL